MEFTTNKPEDVKKFDDGSCFFDFGKHAFGLLEVVINSEKNQEVTISAGEVLTDGRINRAPGGSRIYHEEKHTLSPGENRIRISVRHPGYGSGTLQTDPDIIPFRYAEISPFAGSAEAVQLAVYRNFDDASSDFDSNIPMLNKVWNFCKYSVKATNCFGVFVDGNRERQAYEGDTYINQLSYFACHYDPEIPRATIDRLFDYPTWPTEWQLAMLPIVHDYLLYTGDKESVLRWYDKLKKKLLLNAVNADGLLDVTRLSEEFCTNAAGKNIVIKDIVDWPMGERDRYEFGKINLVPNCWFYMALCRMVQLSLQLGKTCEAEIFSRPITPLRNAIRNTMLKNGLFTDNPESSHTSLHSCIYPLLWGLARSEDIPGILDIIRSKGMACSVFGAQFLLECCCMNGLEDYAIDLMTSTKKRSWLNMLRKGATITMEAWDDSFKPNQDWNHAWGTAPANIIVRHLAGIRPLSPGFKHFTVSPKIGRMSRFSLTTPTPAGPIHLSRNRGKFTLIAPEGTIPVLNGVEISAGKTVF